MSTQFEYAAAALRNGALGIQEHDTAELAGRAGSAVHGWQLVTIQPPWSELANAHSYAHFEFPRTQSTASDRDLEGFRGFGAAVGDGTGQPRQIMSWRRGRRRPRRPSPSTAHSSHRYRTRSGESPARH